MTVLDFLKIAQDHPTKRRLLLDKIQRILRSCKKREECAVRIFKVLSDFLERDVDENIRVVLSVANSLPGEYGASVMKFVDAIVSQKTQFSIARSLDDVVRALFNRIECSDLDNIVYISNESRDFVTVAVTLAILERASELRSCGKDLARSLLALVRRLFESGNAGIASSILNKYSVKIYVHKDGEEIKSARVTIGTDISLDLTEILSLVYPDLSVILGLRNYRE
ncbi:MAG: hypothetical protein RMH84_05825 [Sulfolobales archaeon]|nr:hypothetical protein [Sulfolobales archaeon]MCX8208977.1 hypothetical protein [Sulfolobales archaeon]MDW8011091.1 hypothetical protein [Sulfolobales archaeon]